MRIVVHERAGQAFHTLPLFIVVFILVGLPFLLLCLFLIFTGFSSVLYARLNWQFSVSFQAHVKLSYLVVSYRVNNAADEIEVIVMTLYGFSNLTILDMIMMMDNAANSFNAVDVMNNIDAGAAAALPGCRGWGQS